MADINNCVMTGRLTRDGLFKQSGGYDILEFGLAVNGWKKEDVQFFNVTVFGKQAASLKQYMLKGKQVAVVGAIKLNKWTGKDGIEHTSIGINAQNVTLLADSNNKAPVAITAEVEDEETVF
jgi:single-strand DNA-binding protein